MGQRPSRNHASTGASQQSQLASMATIAVLERVDPDLWG